MKKLPYLRSKLRRGRWFHSYRRGDKEIALGVHGLHPTDPRVTAAWAAEHARWEHSPPNTATPKAGTFAWAVDLHKASPARAKLVPSTRQNRDAILRRYVKAQGARPLSSITAADIEAVLHAKGGNAAVNELKALKPVFAHPHKLRFLPTDPTRGLKIDRPASEGFATAGAEDIEKFQKRWAVGTTERLVFDLALYTGAARTDLVKLGRGNVADSLLSFRRQKTGVLSEVPLTHELRAVIARTPDIAPAFLLTSKGKPFTPAGLGNFLGTLPGRSGLRRGCTGFARRSASTGQKRASQPTRSPPWRATRACRKSNATPAPPTGAAWSNSLWRAHETGHTSPETGHNFATP